MYDFTLAISCCVKHQTFQANSSSILMSPCLNLLHGIQGIAQTHGWRCEPIILSIGHLEGRTVVQLNTLCYIMLCILYLKSTYKNSLQKTNKYRLADATFTPRDQVWSLAVVATAAATIYSNEV